MVTQPAPARRFSRTHSAVRGDAKRWPSWGFTAEEIDGLAAQRLGFAA
jgi:hypothetical protein